MKLAIKTLITLFLISCNKDFVDTKRISKIGEELVKTDFTNQNRVIIQDVVMIGQGLKTELISINQDTTGLRFFVKKGDLSTPIGNSKADAILKIITDNRSIKIRLKYDRKNKKYHILGWTKY